MVLLEASACGLPMIATRLGGIPEVVQDGVNGFLVDSPPDDFDELAGKIITLLVDNDLRQRLGQKARGRRALERFAWQRIAREHGSGV